MSLSRTLLLTALALCTVINARSQSLAHQFSLRLGYSEFASVSDMALDNEGNIYAVGNFTATIDLDPGPGTDLHTSQGDNDFYLAKFDAAGNYLWGQVYGDESSNVCNAIVFDPLSNTIILGGTSDGTIDFGGIQVTHWGTRVAFLCKLTTSGTVVWANNGDSDPTETQTLEDLAVDSAGDIYYTGAWFAAQVSFSQIKVVRVNSAGAVVFPYEYGGVNNDYGTHIVVDQDGNLHVLGVFRYRSTTPHDISFGSFNFTSGSTLDYGDNIVYLKIAVPLGTVLDARRTAHRMDYERPSDLAIDGNGAVYIAGYYGSSFNGSATIFGIVVPEVPDNDLNGFVAKLHPTNTWESWVRVYPNGINYSYMQSLGVDASGLIYAFGRGTTGMDIDPTSTSVLSLPSGNSNFLTRFNNDGSFHDAFFYNSISANVLLPQSDGSVFLGGSYGANNDFDPGSGVITLPTATGVDPYDGYVSKLQNESNVGVAEVGGSDLGIAPNPASVLATITCPTAGATYSVLDLPGHLLQQGRISGKSHQLDVSTLEAGTYLLRIEERHGPTKSLRFVVGGR